MNRLARFYALFKQQNRRRAATIFVAAARRNEEDMLLAIQADVDFEIACSEAMGSGDIPFLRKLRDVITSDSNRALVLDMVEWARWWAGMSSEERDSYRTRDAQAAPTAQQEATLAQHAVPVPPTRTEAATLVQAVAGGKRQEARRARWRRR